MARAVADDGFALIPGVLSPDEVAQARDEIDRLRPFHFDRMDGMGAHFKCVFNRSPYWLPFTDRPGVVELAEATMGEDCHLIGQTCWRTHPQGPSSKPDGFDPNGIHTDMLLFPAEEELLVSGRVHMPVMLATAHYYLSDIDLELCPTWVLPGSHKTGRWAHSVPAEQRTEFRGNKIQPVLCKAGDVLFFRSEVWHSGSHNRSDRTRYMLQVHYGHRMIAQKFSPYLNFNFNAEVLSCANKRQRRLLGDHPQSAYD
ncbi:MAG: phytanoyl-CoA dioxygenase family protein [Planctomycetes bacterium]|nr:phytanoyl-CoA dioxygenase family protein [Planctomycetota bacterium]